MIFSQALFCFDFIKGKGGGKKEKKRQNQLTYSNDTTTSLVTGANTFPLQWPHITSS